MPLNKARGNMYPFVTHTWNPVKGLCPHGCSYCYMNKIYKRFGKTPAQPYLDEKEMRVNLGSGNTIFVGSNIDMFPDIWGWNMFDVLEYCLEDYCDNTYLFQSKNPKRMIESLHYWFGDNVIICTTLESSRRYPEIMGKTPAIIERVNAMRDNAASKYSFRKMLTIEPVLDFDLPYFLRLIRNCGEIEQVNIGADSGNNHLPEPPPEKLRGLIAELEKFTKVFLKKNIRRILK